MSTAAIIAGVAGAIALYIVLSGITFALFERHRAFDRSDRPSFAAAWPIVIVCWVIYQLAMVGPRFISRRQASASIPKSAK